MSGVFAGYEVGFLEHAQRAQSDVFEIADGSGYDVKSSCHYEALTDAGAWQQEYNASIDDSRSSGRPIAFTKASLPYIDKFDSQYSLLYSVLRLILKRY